MHEAAEATVCVMQREVSSCYEMPMWMVHAEELHVTAVQRDGQMDALWVVLLLHVVVVIRMPVIWMWRGVGRVPWMQVQVRVRVRVRVRVWRWGLVSLMAEWREER